MESEFVSAEMRTYTHDEFTHSILLEAETDYGDTLPYLFSCAQSAEGCEMHLDGEEVMYSLEIEDGIVTLVTNDTAFDRVYVSTFQITEP